MDGCYYVKKDEDWSIELESGSYQLSEIFLNFLYYFTEKNCDVMSTFGFMHAADIYKANSELLIISVSALPLPI